MEPFETKVVRGVTLRKDPAREACFTVADTDDQMISWPDWSDQSKRERIHRHMNNEITSLEIAAQCLPISPTRRGSCAWSWPASAGTKRATSGAGSAAWPSWADARASSPSRTSSGRSPAH